MIVSREAKKKQAIHDKQVSYLQDRHSEIRKHSESYRLAIKDLACSDYIESVNQQWSESVPPIRSTSHRLIKPIRAPMLENLLLGTHSNKQIVPSLCQESLTHISL